MAGRPVRLVGLMVVAIALSVAAGALARAPFRAAAPSAPGAGPLVGPDRAATGPRTQSGSKRARAGGVTADELRSDLATQMRATGGASGAFVVDLDATSGSQLFSWASKTPRILASNTKLFTTAAFLERYGADKTFTTHVWSVGRRSEPGGRVLDGRLALVGAGDPTLADGSFARTYGLPVTRLGPLAAAGRDAGLG